jgi:hypothetical protein
METQNVKWTKGGQEILTTDGGGQIIRSHGVVGIETVSLKTILDLFPSEIWTIQARTKSDTTVNKLQLKEVGAVLIKSTSEHFILNNTNKDVNLWHEWVGKLKTFMKENNIKDAPVQRLSLRITDEQLLEIAQVHGFLEHVKKPDFLLEFAMHHCEGDSDKARLLAHKINSNLIQNSGWKYDMLHCQSVYSVEDVNSVPKERRTPIVDWRLTGVKNQFSPIDIAKRIKIHLKDFGTIKKYDMRDFRKLMLVSCE